MLKPLRTYLILVGILVGIWIPQCLFSQGTMSSTPNSKLLWQLVHSESSDSLAHLLKQENPNLYNHLTLLENSYGFDSVSSAMISALTELTNTAPTQTQAATEIMIAFATNHGDTLYMARAYALLAKVIFHLGENQKALEYSLIALDYAEKANDEALKLNIFNNLGSLHVAMGDYKTSALYYRRYIQEAKARNNLRKVATGYLNIGNTYSEDQQEDSSQYFYEKALVLARKLGMKTVEAYALGNLAATFIETGDLEKSIAYQTAGLAIEKATNDNIAMIDSHNVLASCYAKLNNRNMALYHYEEAMNIALAIDAKFKMLDLLHSGQEVYADLGHYDKAYAVSRQYQHLNDSLLNAQRNAQFAELREKYEAEQKEATIDRLEEAQKISDLEIAQKQTENLALGVVVLLLLMLAIFILVVLLQGKRRRKEVEARNEMITKINKALSKSQDALIQSNKTKDKFFALIAHDLRGPVTSLQGIGRMLNYYAKKGNTDRIEQLIAQVDQSATSVNHLLDNLLKWALSQTEGLNYQPVNIELSRLAEEVRIIFEEALKAKEIELKMDMDELVVEADYNMISTVLRNLLSNAIKFSPAGSQVSLSVRVVENSALISISDSGPGMPEKTVHNLLNNQPVSSTRGTQDEKGTGLGLTLCREFIKKHGGDLAISSSENGTCISFELSLVDQPQNA